MGFAKLIRKQLKIVALLEVQIILASNVKLDSISFQENANNQTSSAVLRKILTESV
jgi:hypothetical protein